MDIVYKIQRKFDEDSEIYCANCKKEMRTNILFKPQYAINFSQKALCYNHTLEHIYQVWNNYGKLIYMLLVNYGNLHHELFIIIYLLYQEIIPFPEEYSNNIDFIKQNIIPSIKTVPVNERIWIDYYNRILDNRLCRNKNVAKFNYIISPVIYIIPSNDFYKSNKVEYLNNIQNFEYDFEAVLDEGVECSFCLDYLSDDNHAIFYNKSLYMYICIKCKNNIYVSHTDGICIMNINGSFYLGDCKKKSKPLFFIKIGDEWVRINIFKNTINKLLNKDYDYNNKKAIYLGRINCL